VSEYCRDPRAATAIGVRRSRTASPTSGRRGLKSLAAGIHATSRSAA
jgi:hypothetical protein